MINNLIVAYLETFNAPKVINEQTKIEIINFIRKKEFPINKKGTFSEVKPAILVIK